MDFNHAYNELVASWLCHEDLKASGAPVAELFAARSRLDNARLLAARYSHL